MSMEGEQTQPQEDPVEEQEEQGQPWIEQSAAEPPYEVPKPGSPRFDVLSRARYALDSQNQKLQPTPEELKRRAAEQRRLSTKPKSMVTTTAPMSLVRGPYPGRAPNPEEWRTSFAVDDPKEVSARDSQLERELEKAAKRERERFSSVLWMQHRLAEQQRAATAPVASQRLTEYDERVNRTWMTSLQLHEERQKAKERKMTDKERRAAERTAMLAISRSTSALNLAAESSQQMMAALERAQELTEVRQLSAQAEHLQKEAHRQACEQRRLAESQQRLDESTRSSMHIRATAAQRKEVYDQQVATHYAHKAAKGMSAAEQAEARKQQMLAAEAQHIAAVRNQKESAVMAHHEQQARVVMNKHQAFAQKQAQREARAAQRAAETKRRLQEVDNKNMARMIGNYWAKELEIKATWTKKVPQVPPQVSKSLSRLQVAA